MAMPSTWCAIAHAWPATMTSTSPRGSHGRRRGSRRRIAGRQVVGAIEAGAASAGVGGDDDDVGALRPQRGRVRPDGVDQRRHRQPADVAGDGRGQGASVITPTMPTLMPATSTSVVGRTLVHVGVAPLAVSIRFAARNGKRASAARARSAPRGSSAGSAASPPCRPAEVELVVADRRGGVAEGVVGRHDGRPFADVRFERALEHVAGVDQEHRAAVTRPGRTQVLDVAAEQREPPRPFRATTPPCRSLVPTIDIVRAPRIPAPQPAAARRPVRSRPRGAGRTRRTRASRGQGRRTRGPPGDDRRNVA